MEAGTIRKFVRERYGNIARQETSCCGPAKSCCGGKTAEAVGRQIGYSDDELRDAPEGANLGLGCGNPIALASLKKGETVLDLGSGAGFDCFLAAREVGPAGRAIGVDMTPEMVEKARENARKTNRSNVEFRLGEIEHLPVADESVDAIISNCVINLSPSKEEVFMEAYRVLRPGGRFMISDIMLTGKLPMQIRESLAAHAGCIAGAIPKEEYLGLLSGAGFRDVRVVQENAFAVPELETDAYAKSISETFAIPSETVLEATRAIASVRISGTKP